MDNNIVNLLNNINILNKRKEIIEQLLDLIEPRIESETNELIDITIWHYTGKLSSSNKGVFQFWKNDGFNKFKEQLAQFIDNKNINSKEQWYICNIALSVQSTANCSLIQELNEDNFNNRISWNLGPIHIISDSYKTNYLKNISEYSENIIINLWHYTGIISNTTDYKQITFRKTDEFNKLITAIKDHMNKFNINSWFVCNSEPHKMSAIRGKGCDKIKELNRNNFIDRIKFIGNNNRIDIISGEYAYKYNNNIIKFNITNDKNNNQTYFFLNSGHLYNNLYNELQKYGKIWYICKNSSGIITKQCYEFLEFNEGNLINFIKLNKEIDIYSNEYAYKNNKKLFITFNIHKNTENKDDTQIYYSLNNDKLYDNLSEFLNEYNQKWYICKEKSGFWEKSCSNIVEFTKDNLNQLIKTPGMEIEIYSEDYVLTYLQSIAQQIKIYLILDNTEHIISQFLIKDNKLYESLSNLLPNIENNIWYLSTEKTMGGLFGESVDELDKTNFEKTIESNHSVEIYSKDYILQKKDKLIQKIIIYNNTQDKDNSEQKFFIKDSKLYDAVYDYLQKLNKNNWYICTQWQSSIDIQTSLSLKFTGELNTICDNKEKLNNNIFNELITNEKPIIVYSFNYISIFYPTLLQKINIHIYDYISGSGYMTNVNRDKLQNYIIGNKKSWDELLTKLRKDTQWFVCNNEYKTFDIGCNDKSPLNTNKYEGTEFSRFNDRNDVYIASVEYINMFHA